MSSAAYRRLVAEGYDEIAGAYLDWSSDMHLRVEWLGHLCRLLTPASKVLDLGCGAGLPVARRLVAEGHTVVGIDGSAAQIELARRNVPEATFEVADMTQIAPAPGSLDAVVALYSITHVPRREHAELLERIRTWLKPSGLLLASLGANESPDWTGEWLGTTMFFSHFDAAENLRLLSDAGFELVRSRVTGEVEEGNVVEFLWVIARTPE